MSDPALEDELRYERLLQQLNAERLAMLQRPQRASNGVSANEERVEQAEPEHPDQDTMDYAS